MVVCECRSLEAILLPAFYCALFFYAVDCVYMEFLLF